MNYSRRNRILISASALAILSFIFLLAVGGCNKTETDSDNQTPASTPTSINLSQRIDENVTGEVTINWWHFWTDPTINPTIESIVADFERDNPNIKVNLTGLTWANGHEKIVIALASGTGPDLLELGSDWIPEFVESNQLTDLTANLDDERADFAGWEPVTRDERLYGRPWILGTRVMFYNTALLKQAGFEDGYVPLTLKEFRETCYRIDSLGAKIYGWGSNAAETHRLYKKFLPFFWTYGASIFSENGEYCTLPSMEAGNALKYYKELHDSCSLVDTQRRLEDAFLAGKVGAVMSGDWLLKRIRNEKPDFTFTTGMMPGKSLNGTSFLGGEYLVVNQASEDKGAALKLLRHITSAKNQLRFCKANFSSSPSSLLGATDSFFTSDPHFMTFIKQIRFSKAPPFEPRWVYIEAEIEKAIERTIFEGQLPFEALHQARIKIQQISRPTN